MLVKVVVVVVVVLMLLSLFCAKRDKLGHKLLKTLTLTKTGTTTTIIISVPSYLLTSLCIDYLFEYNRKERE